MSHQNHLIIFIKNPELGKVKTRIAATVGDEKALAIYHQLLDILKKTLLPLEGVSTHLFFSERVEETEMWLGDKFQKNVQVRGDLGHKMKTAFDEVFSGCDQLTSNKVVIIGSDCPEINGEILADAFRMLDTSDVVLGPTYDGGYYLLGMNAYHPFLFDGVSWSTELVMEETLSIILSHRLTYALLPKLSDIDTEADWDAFMAKITK